MVFRITQTDLIDLAIEAGRLFERYDTGHFPPDETYKTKELTTAIRAKSGCAARTHLLEKVERKLTDKYAKENTPSLQEV